MKEKFFHRLGLKQEFRDALNAKQIEPYYQPIVNLGSGKIEGFEALARWRHPAKGILTPFFFGEMISDPELGMLLGKVMFEQIADDMARWHAAGIPFETIGLNIVDGDLNRETLAQDLLDGLHGRGLSPQHLAIEVTEHCLFGANKDAFVAQLKTLNNAGCPIALDDFGTGYSSITQLKDLPITSVKIDKSFVDNVLDSKDDQSIISALNDLGHSMNFRLVLEGIETQGQMDMLQQLDSALGQGYHFARPMPAGEVPTYLAQRASEGTKQQQFPKAG